MLGADSHLPPRASTSRGNSALLVTTNICPPQPCLRNPHEYTMASPKPEKNTPLPSVMQPQKKETFGNLGPWAEPSWYSSLASPYYNDSHRRLRNALRQYIDENVKPYMLEWEEKGEAPEEVRLKWAKTGFPFGDVPEPYRPKDVPGPAGIPVGEMDIFHLLVSTDEGSRYAGHQHVWLVHSATDKH